MPIDKLTPFDDEEIQKIRDENTRRRSTHHFATDCCEQLRRDIVVNRSSDIADKVPAEGPPQFFIIIGPPASGKSTLVNEFKKEMALKVVDSDEIKSLLPEFSSGRHARVVHEESSELNKTVLERALYEGANVIYPTVGRTPDEVVMQANRFNDFGYDVHLYCKYIDPQVAAERAMNRFRKGEKDPLTGETIHRFVDPLYILDAVGKLPLKTYFAIKNNLVFKTRKLITE